MRSPLLLSIALSAICAAALQAQNVSTEQPSSGAKPAAATPAPEAKPERKSSWFGRSKAAEPQPSTPAPAKAASPVPAPATPRPAVTGGKATPAPAATPEPATPAPKKPSFFRRLFGGKPEATPAPATPAPTPTPATPRPRRPRKPAEATEAPKADTTSENKTEEKHESAPAATEAKPDETEKPATAPETSPAKPEEPATPAATPETKAEKPEKATPAPGKKGRGKATGAKQPASAADAPATKEQQALQDALASGDADAIEAAKYNEVKARAIQDPHVQELKEKADNAASNEENTKALRAYNKALFQKMRSLSDGSVRDRIDRMEAAILKKLSKPGSDE